MKHLFIDCTGTERFVHIICSHPAKRPSNLTMKSKQQTKLKLEAHITAGQLTAPVLMSMFPQFSRDTIYNKSNHFKKFGSHSRQPGSGWPKKLFGNDLKNLCKLVENSSQISAKDVLRSWRAGVESRYQNGLSKEPSRHLATKRNKQNLYQISQTTKNNQEWLFAPECKTTSGIMFLSPTNVSFTSIATLWCIGTVDAGHALRFQNFHQNLWFGGL